MDARPPARRLQTGRRKEGGHPGRQAGHHRHHRTLALLHRSHRRRPLRRGQHGTQREQPRDLRPHARPADVALAEYGLPAHRLHRLRTDVDGPPDGQRPAPANLRHLARHRPHLPRRTARRGTARRRRRPCPPRPRATHLELARQCPYHRDQRVQGPLHPRHHATTVSAPSSTAPTASAARCSPSPEPTMPS